MLSEEPIPLATLPRSPETLAGHDATSAPQNTDNDPGIPIGVHVQELPPIDRGTKAWTFCFCSFILETMVWGFGFSYGIFQVYYMTHAPFKASSTVAISAIGTTALSLQYGECLLILLFYRRYPELIRSTMWFGLALCTLSLVASSFANKIWQLILLQGVFFGIGGGLLYVPVILWLPEWFYERRGLAGGFIFGGSGIGGFAFPLLVNALLQSVGFRWTLRIWAAMMAIISSLAMLGVHSRTPIPKYRRQQNRPAFIPAQMPFFQTRLFWSFTVSSTLQALSYFPVSLYIAVFTTSISSPLSATVVLSIFNSSAIIGQIFIGHLSDRFPYPKIMFISATGSAAAAFFLWGFSQTLAQVFVFAIIFGGLSGGFTSVWPVAATECSHHKPELIPWIMGCFAVMKGIAATVGPVLSGILHEAGRSSAYGAYGRFGFGKVEIFVGSCAAMTGVGSLIVASARGRLRQPEGSN
ncbi:hypothetical protein JAAARDRAFT_54845 [Jaapia argillacea MUCL 33604]|uniref:Major facilitator superfamily (MFS) profile domain-containing protein n=1 Tax=Jaapia argillacea MUCL 33604 TaxID=933084 RepID=A0A067Q3E4_9AGAM|nr:hypothetical protein JAAARDRAFT_54845 [Jaapia argillacea MUCL 33604]